MTEQPALIPGCEAGDVLPSGLAEMHKMHGTQPDMICGDCVFILKCGDRGHRWHKCVKSRVTSGPASDWRLKWPACGLWRRNGQ